MPSLLGLVMPSLTLCSSKAVYESDASLSTCTHFPKSIDFEQKCREQMDCDADTLDIPANAQHAEDISLPADAAERKRVLNILAQRRYRRRRRERQAALESIVGLSRSIEEVHPTAAQRNEQRSSSDESPSSGSTDSNATSNADTSISNASSNSGPYNNNAISSTSLTPELINWPTNDESIWPVQALDNGNTIANLLQDTTWDATGDFCELKDFLQTDDVQNASFADDWHIAVPELDLLRAAYDNAGRMNSSHLLFAGLTAQSVFQTSDCSNWVLTLPENLMPTEAQLTVSHHPAIDILPWPAVRNRLIKMYNMPPDLWPQHPSDGTQSSLVRFIYDMEDGGIRVTGQDPAKESAWEIDQRFFENWWWALDQTIVANTNVKRMARGQRMLCASGHGPG